MSEEGGFIDVESDEVPELGGEATASSNSNDPMVGVNWVGMKKRGEEGTYNTATVAECIFICPSLGRASIHWMRVTAMRYIL